MSLKLNTAQSKDEPLWSGIAYRVFVSTISHPTEYAKILIQLGHEPIEPWPTTTLFRKPALALPNVFQYVSHIKRIDGFAGCYRGFVPKICASALCAIAVDKTLKFIDDCDKKKPKENEEEISEEEEESWDKFLFKMVKELCSIMVGVIVSHPLEVVSLRMMAQFVGRETKYRGIFSSLIEIYKDNGIAGYYAGLAPRLIGNASLIVLSSTLVYCINKYFICDHDLKGLNVFATKFLLTTLTYPFFVVSHCMTVNNCGLAAGLPPNMPVYNNWQDCWSHLSSTNQLKRGSSLLWRYYTGPRVLINGKLVPIEKNHFYLQGKMQ